MTSGAGPTSKSVGEPLLTAVQVDKATFATMFRGYSLEEVDAFLDAVARTLKAWESGRRPTGGVDSVSAESVTFGTGFKGYDMGEIDDFIDRIVATLKSYEDNSATPERPNS